MADNRDAKKLWLIPFVDDADFHGSSNRTKSLAVLLLMAVTAFALFYRLDYPLFEPDETRNAQLALTMVDTGNWLAPQLNDQPYWDKPPLQAWLTAASYRCLGTTNLATRLPTSLACLLAVLLTLTTGRRLVGFEAAYIGAILLALCGGFVAMGRYVTMDMLLTLWTTGTLLFGFRALQNKRRRFAYCLGAGAMIGLGILTKGPVAAVICLPPLIASAWLSNREANADTKTCGRSVLIFSGSILTVAAPWFIYTAIANPDYLGYYVWKQHVLRYSHAFVHQQPFWYYVPAFFVMMFPASYLLPSTIWFLASRQESIRACRTRETGFLTVAVVWIFGFFTFSDSKLPTYILPALPLLCLIMGVMLDSTVLRPSAAFVGTKTLLSRIPRLATVGLTTLLVILAALTFVHFPTTNISLKAVAMLVGALAVIGLSVATFVGSKSVAVPWVATAAIAWLALLLGLNHIAPEISLRRSAMLNAASVQQNRDNRQTPVIYFGRDPHASSMQLNPATVYYFNEKELASVNAFIASHPDAIIVSADHQLANLNVFRKMSEVPAFVFQPLPVGRHLYSRQATGHETQFSADRHSDASAANALLR